MSRLSFCLPLLLGPVLLPAAAAPPVELELLSEPGFPITGTHQWLEVLSNVGAASVRIRQAQLGEKGEIRNLGSDRAPRYHVKGILTARNTLRLPGATFRLSDRQAIRQWIQKLQIDGIEGLQAKTGAFGLTSKQLLAVHDKLAVKVALATKGQRVGQVVSSIARQIEIPLGVTPETRPSLEGPDTVPEELMGISSGTALAAALRPLGLVLVPQRPPGGQVRLVIADVRQAREVWPVGWPPEKSPGKTLPKLFDFLNVEISDYSLAAALDAISQRIKAPILYDHNALARHDVDPAKVKVSLPKGRTYYKKVIDRLLAQTKPPLMAELRVDEAGQPLLWVTTVRP